MQNIWPLKNAYTNTYHKEVKAFPEIDEFTLKVFEAEGRTARQRMLNLKFDS
jgi:hypothetical protein